MNIPDPFSNYKNIIPDFNSFLEHLTSPLPAYIRLNTLKAPESSIINRLKKEGITLEKTGIRWLFRVHSSGELRAGLSYQLGYTYPQALSSTLPVIALDVHPGYLVLDLCAAPGGKSTYMAQIMGDTGTILANDRKYGRITALMSNVKRMGITNTVITNCRGEFLAPGIRFDRVLVDAPCSGEGRYRIYRDGRMSHRRSGSTDLPAIQKGIVQHGFDLLRPGGIMVYSTCTLNPRENEEVVNHLMKKRPAALEAWHPPVISHPGIRQWQEKEYDPIITRCRRFYSHEIQSVGFFVARIRKK